MVPPTILTGVTSAADLQTTGAEVETMAEKEAVIEQEAPEVDVHPSIANMLSHDPEAAAMGGLDLDDTEVEVDPDKAEQEAAALEEKGEEKEAEPPPAEKVFTQADVDAQVDAFKKKALDETNKRQNLERQQTAKPEEKADLFEEPDKRLAQELDPVVDTMTNRFLTLSESNARRFYGADKYNAAQSAFLSAAEANPALATAAMQSADPGDFQFQEGQKILTNQQLGEAGGLEKLQEQADAKALANLQDRIKKGVEAKLKDIKDLPPNAMNFNGKNNKQKVVDTNMSLSDILQE